MIIFFASRKELIPDKPVYFNPKTDEWRYQYEVPGAKHVRPVVHGKTSKPTELGAKLPLSIDEWGFARIEYLSFDAYNEGPMLIQAFEDYRYHHGYCDSRRTFLV